MVMIHKFLADNNISAQSLIDAGIVPTFEKFETQQITATEFYC